MAEHHPSPLLALRDAGHSWDGAIWQFRSLDLDVGPGEVLAVLGPNGRGKSSLLRVMAGLTPPTLGRREAAAPMGFVPQSFTGVFPMSVLDLVLMGRARHISLFAQPGARDVAIARAALADLGVDGLEDRPIGTLSGGQRQLVLIARALAGESPLLLLDEPGAALDPRNQDLVLGTLGRLAERGLAIVFTTHHPSHVLEIADRALLMLDPGDHRLGPVADVMTEPDLSRLYGMAMRTLDFSVGATRLDAIVPVFTCRLPSPPESSQETP